MLKETAIKVTKKSSPKEMNPYFQNDGSEDGTNFEESNLLSTSVVRDGGASWRLKALKRAQEQAARNGKNLDEVVGEQWGSSGESAVSMASSASVAPSHAHLHATKNRIRRKDKEQPVYRNQLGDDRRALTNLSNFEEPSRTDIMPAMSANQLAAKVIHLRLKGKHEEAEKILKEAEVHQAKSQAGTTITNSQGDGTTSRYIMHGLKLLEKKKEENADMHIARSIIKNKKYSISDQADDEYDNDVGPLKKKRIKGDDVSNLDGNTRFEKRILTQQERCNFCFENPKRPQHLVVAIANFTYLMLPQSQPVVPGHCYILPMQHELATRSVDDDVWDEIRNFKKCLLMMFAKQQKDVVFLETAMGFAKQRRHCLIECIPLPSQIAKQAPLYFKKAIDEAEEEWSQHNAKKLIDTSEKGLRHSIPKDFPYFHVEFGLKKGFVHVIDDESQFKTTFGLDVIRGMLGLPMHRTHLLETNKKIAVSNFVTDWEPFDWTKQLH